MSKKEKRLMRMQFEQSNGNFLLSLVRKNCTDCGSSDLFQANEKLALEYLKDTPERRDKLIELIEIIGWAECWVCRQCKAFGAMPMTF